MSEMVERVARAMATASGGYWFQPPYNALHTDALNNHWRHKARAAIEAMREPTPRMAAAGFVADDCTAPMDIFRAMVDAALTETSSPSPGTTE